MPHADRFALVTGAHKGIGLEIARQLGEAGVTALVGSRDPARGQDAVEALCSEGFRAALVALDVMTLLALAPLPSMSRPRTSVWTFW